MLETRSAVLIIGAGAAGIAAAAKLLANGFTDVTILEAENRIGGRVHTVNFDDVTVDLGAQWIHGENGNIIYEMVKGLDLVDYPKTSNYQDLSFFVSDGQKLSKNLLDQLHKMARNVIEDTASVLGHEGTLKEYWNEKFFDMVVEKYGTENDAVITVARMVREWVGKFYQCLDPAESLDQVACSSLVKYEECEGDHLVHWKTNGYSKVFEILMTKIANISLNEFIEKHVKLNKEVCKINWGNGVEAQCSDGSLFKADHVIVTVSVGVLQENHQQWFEPLLPQYKIDCIQYIPLGSCNKIFLKFEEKWWPDGIKDFSFLWTEEDAKSFIKECSYKPSKNGRCWLQDIFGFYTVDNDPNILLGWLIGPFAREVELKPDQEIIEESLFLLRKFLPSDLKIPDQSRVSLLSTKWATNPHFRGTYSYVGKEMEDRQISREDLAKPLQADGRMVVQFAGEATHSRYFSTVHGAIETGYREAERIINFYQNLSKTGCYKVAIIGAGLAGLGAATKLVQNNINDFIVLEAQHEAGGRIKTIYYEGKPLDLGAQWMHGKSNELFKLAIENNLVSEEVSEEGVGEYVRSNREVVDPFKVAVVDVKIGQILQDCAKLASSQDYVPSLNILLEQQFFQYLDEKVTDPNENEIFRELYDWHVRFQVIDNSCNDLSRLSAKRWGDYICPDDETHSNLKYGYQSLVQTILNNIPNDCIKYDSEVIGMRFRERNTTIELKLSNGNTFICDHLILTPSLGVLKEFDGLEEVLTEEMILNIKNMGFDSICKIYLFYDVKWWGDSKGFQLLWKQDCSFKEKDTWLRHVTGFDKVVNHETALMTWVGKEDAVKEAESLSPEEIGVQCTELLQKFLTGYTVSLPKKVIRTQWLSNRFVKGSYCHITPDCDNPASGIQALKKPMVIENVPRIVLAGEAVHSSSYSTTHGAYESGLEQARTICQYINK